MARYTPRFGLQVIEPGDDPYIHGHKFFSADRDTIDTVMWMANGGHHHNGAAGASAAPDTAPELTLDTVGGTIGAGARIYYTYTLVNTTTLLETAPAPVSFIDTPSPIVSPGAPTLSWGSGSGTLLPGQYFYVLSAWTDVNTNETKAEQAAGVIVAPGTTTNRVIITLPSLPAGADGFNIYRRTPGGTKYLHLASVDMTVATPPTTYTDDGTVDEDCDRVGATRNTTNATNQITIDYPGATPAVPVGFYWKIYRSVTDGVWSASTLHLVVEETAEGSGIITTRYVDTGIPTATGEPPTGTFDFASPDPIDLTDAAEVQGTLPAGMVAAFPHVETFYFPGTVDVAAGTTQWRCPYPNATVLAVAGHLDLGSLVPSTDIQIEVHRHRAGVDTDLYGGPYPEVPVGENAGDFLAPPLIASATLLRDDTITVSCVQDGGGATPTAVGLTVTVYLIAYGFDAATSYVPGQTNPLGLF